MLLAGRDRGEHKMLGNNCPWFGGSWYILWEAGEQRDVLLKKQAAARAERAVGDSWASLGDEEGGCLDLNFTKIMLMQRMDCRGAIWASGKPLRQLLFLSRWGITKG